MTDKWKARERKYKRDRYGMRVSGRSLVHIQNAIIKRANKKRKANK